MRNRAILIAALVAGFLPSIGAAAEFMIDREPWFLGRGGTIKIIGDIKKGDYYRFFDTVVTARRHYPLRVQLHSNGGNLVEAMRIAGQIRGQSMVTGANARGEGYRIDVNINTDDVPSDLEYACFSSCVLIWAAGVQRNGGWGTLGMHRPAYDDDFYAGLSYEESSEAYTVALDKMRSYLERMDIPRSIIDSSFSVSSSELRILSSEEMATIVGDYRGYVPFMAEYMRSRCGSLSQNQINETYTEIFAAGSQITEDEIFEIEEAMREIYRCERNVLIDHQMDRLPK
jgi:hypothetical protein